MAEGINIKTGASCQAYLAQLLQDPVFVDYFNVYLSLPIFSQRILYKYADRDFDFDPPLHRKYHVLDRHKFAKWLVNERLRGFLESELHLEYTLCRHLLDVQPKLSHSSHSLEYGIERQLEDEAFVKKSIGHVCGMVRFRRYIAVSDGEKILEFWKDAERFNRTSEDNITERKSLFREIQLKYFRGGQGFIGLEDKEMWTVLSDSEKVMQLARTLSPTFIKTELNEEPLIEPLQQLQAALLEVLQQYWFPKFLLHCRREDKKTKVAADSYKIRRVSDLRILREVQDIDRAMLLVQGNLRPDPKARKRRGEVRWNAMFQEKVDISFLNSTDDVVTLHDDGNVTVNRLDSPSLKREPPLYPLAPVPQIEPSGNGRVKLNDAVDSSIHTSSSMNSEEMCVVISSSTNLNQDFLLTKPEDVAVRKSFTDDLMEKIAEAERIRDSKLKSHLSLSERNELKKVVSTASSVASSVGSSVQPTPIERPRTSPFPERSRIPKPHKKRIPFHEILPPVCKSEMISEIEKHDANMYNCYSRSHEGPEVKPLDLKCTGFSTRTFRHDNRVLIGAIVSDGVAGHPFRKYLQSTGNVLGLRYLTFWQVCLIYLSTKEAHTTNEGTRMRWLRARMLILNHLMSGSCNYTDLPSGLSLLLRRELPEGQGEDLLRLAQDYVCQFLVSVWDKFKHQDRDLFIKSSLASRPRQGIQRKGSFPEGLRRFKVLPPLKVPPKKAVLEHRTADVDLGIVSEAEDPDKIPVPVAQEKECSEVDGQEYSADDMTFCERRMWRALRLSVDIMGLETESLLVDPLTVKDLHHDELDDEGSLAYKPLISIEASEIREQIRREKEAEAAARAARKALQDAQAKRIPTPEEEIEDTTPVYARPFRKNGILYTRPPKPRSFTELLRNPNNFQFFLRFMKFHNAETPLLFWQAAQELRNTTDPKQKQIKLNKIIRKFFLNRKGFQGLDCHSEVICEIPKLDKVSASMLTSAQSVIFRDIENKWFAKYIDTYPKEEVVRSAISQFYVAGKKKKVPTATLR